MYSPEKPGLQEIQCMVILSNAPMDMPILKEKSVERRRDSMIFYAKEIDIYNII